AIDAAVNAGVLQPQDGQRLLDAQQARRQVIDVDAFQPEQLALTEGQIR
ncbi:hypothetical protein G7011_11695, partial [Pseudomonas plecoglossicida]|nr:hypothetical protein [Pseudomonas plecoglossicida]